MMKKNIQSTRLTDWCFPFRFRSKIVSAVNPISMDSICWIDLIFIKIYSSIQIEGGDFFFCLSKFCSILFNEIDAFGWTNDTLSF